MSSPAENLYAAIEKTAGLVDVPCAREKVWPILSAFEELLPQAAILFRVATDARHAGEINCHMMMLPSTIDPHALAQANGLLPRKDHPIDSLLGDIEAGFPIGSYGVDFGLVGGFQKAWSCFPGEQMQSLPKLAALPSMPPSVAGNMDFFERYGLAEKITLIGMDYGHRTMNVYFGEVDDCLTPAAVRSMLSDIGMPEPSEHLLTFAQQAFGFYTTLSWDSPDIERFCYSAITPDPLAILDRVEPKIEHFLREIPYGADNPKAVYVATSPGDGEYCKVQSYYQWRPRLVNHMHTTAPPASG
ncbi:aromatic prenyltransferase [Streptomyces sp. CNQ-509]|uniref:aromatic prenyltransferase n=1 Tax=Streptomyces sp. CNQ-509 TaxID=444103 RepID=UPI00062DD3D0|nr:aromatic prenyltransferase [Streptomyces sp. CNQ-509]AKH82933.1 aromatic prenyltransferase [Streptomyces sp. CNQ-509]